MTRTPRIAVGPRAVDTPAGVASAINRVQDSILAALDPLAADAARGVSPLTPAGGRQPAMLLMGSGVPSNAYGRDGWFYFRTDTPGVANQRIYVKIAGVWTGIA